MVLLIADDWLLLVSMWCFLVFQCDAFLCIQNIKPHKMNVKHISQNISVKCCVSVPYAVGVHVEQMQPRKCTYEWLIYLQNKLLRDGPSCSVWLMAKLFLRAQEPISDHAYSHIICYAWNANSSWGLNTSCIRALALSAPRGYFLSWIDLDIFLLVVPFTLKCFQIIYAFWHVYGVLIFVDI